MKRITSAVLCIVASYSVCANEPSVGGQSAKERMDAAIKELDARAEDSVLENEYPDPDFIRRGNRLKERSEAAAYEVLIPPKNQRSRKIHISEKDMSIHKINVYPNQITALTITDSLGHPWPLKTTPIVASSSYQVNYNAGIEGLVTIETNEKFVPSSMLLALDGRLRPIQFQLASDNATLDYSLEIIVAGKSPSNSIQIERPFNDVKIPEHDSNRIVEFLDSAPDGAQRLPTVGNENVRVWAWNGMFVIRTPFQLLDPSRVVDVKSRMNSDDRVYLVSGKLDVMTMLNDKTGEFISVEVVGAN